MNNNMWDKLIESIAESKNTVVVTGAGISTEAGIPDFRGENGIYKELGENKVMTIINIDNFRKNPQSFYDFYWKHFSLPEVAPSKAHIMLAKLETNGYVKGVVTQNIDNLHERAGSRNVVPIHGNSDYFVCMNNTCRKQTTKAYAEKFAPGLPKCEHCDSILKPDVILFGENINNYQQAYNLIIGAEILLIIGTSLTVYPLAGIVNDYAMFSSNIIIINKGKTPFDRTAMLKIDVNDMSTGEILETLFSRLPQSK